MFVPKVLLPPNFLGGIFGPNMDIFAPIIGTFVHLHPSIGLSGSFGALLVGWLLVVGGDAWAALTIERLPNLLYNTISVV